MSSHHQRALPRTLKVLSFEPLFFSLTSSETKFVPIEISLLLLIVCPLGPSSTPLRKLQELVKLIHGSSVELLSTNCSEAEGLKPHDYKLLCAAISNISLLLKDKVYVIESEYAPIRYNNNG